MGSQELEIDEIRQKVQRYCAYQDRCHAEVRTKLLNLGARGEELEELIGELIMDGFLSEERFAHSFARGKFRMKGWGRNRIRRELAQRHIHERLIEKAIQNEISEEEYLETAHKTATKKAALLQGEETDWIRKEKIKKYLYQRGFEWEVINEVLGKD